MKSESLHEIKRLTRNQKSYMKSKGLHDIKMLT